MEKLSSLTKKYMVNEIRSKLDKCPNFFIVNFKTVKMRKLQTLRKELKPSKTEFMIIRNSLLKHILHEKSFTSLEGVLMQTSALCFNEYDPILCSKALATFEKENEGFRVRGGVLDGAIITDAQCKELSMLGSRDLLVAKVVGGIKSPLAGLVNSLGGLTRKLVNCLDAISKKKTI